MKRYVKSTEVVEAEVLSAEKIEKAGRELKYAKPGDVLVRPEYGPQCLMTADEFKATYEEETKPTSVRAVVMEVLEELGLGRNAKQAKPAAGG